MAVLEGNELIRFGVRSFAGKKTEDAFLAAAEKYVADLLKEFGPNVVAVEDVYYAQARLSPLLCKLTACVKRWSRQRGVRVVGYLPTTVKERLCAGKRTRGNLAEAMVCRYWFLYSFLQTRRPQVYWRQMFDAVALGTLAAMDLGKQKIRRKKSISRSSIHIQYRRRNLKTA